MTQAFEISFRKATKPGTFWPIYCGEKLTNATRQPFFDGARALLADGVSPEWTLIGRHEGSQTIALQSTVGEAAKWSVSEPDRGKCKRIPYAPYKPGSSDTGDSPAADVDAGGSSSASDERCPTTGTQEAMASMRAGAARYRGALAGIAKSDCQDEPRITHAPDSPIPDLVREPGRKLVPRPWQRPTDPTIAAEDPA